MKKKYIIIEGFKIAYKGELNWYRIDDIGRLVLSGSISGTLNNGGWWIVAKK